MKTSKQSNSQKGKLPILNEWLFDKLPIRKKTGKIENKQYVSF
jgi:hypothetical protein